VDGLDAYLWFMSAAVQLGDISNNQVGHTSLVSVCNVGLYEAYGKMRSAHVRMCYEILTSQ